jgi:hypothetical protein
MGVLFIEIIDSWSDLEIFLRFRPPTFGGFGKLWRVFRWVPWWMFALGKFAIWSELMACQI